jgi:hypothetical protein
MNRPADWMADPERALGAFRQHFQPCQNHADLPVVAVEHVVQMLDLCLDQSSVGSQGVLIFE